MYTPRVRVFDEILYKVGTIKGTSGKKEIHTFEWTRTATMAFLHKRGQSKPPSRCMRIEMNNDIKHWSQETKGDVKEIDGCDTQWRAFYAKKMDI